MTRAVITRDEPKSMEPEARVHFLNDKAVRICKYLSAHAGLKGLGVHHVEIEPGNSSTEFHFQGSTPSSRTVLNRLGVPPAWWRLPSYYWSAPRYSGHGVLEARSRTPQTTSLGAASGIHVVAISIASLALAARSQHENRLDFRNVFVQNEVAFSGLANDQFP